MMTSDMKRFAQTDLYRGLAYLTDGFLQTDQTFLDDVLAEDEPRGTERRSNGQQAG